MKVSIRKKKNYLYLDYLQNGKRTWEATHIRLTGNPETDATAWSMAEQIRAQRELQIVSGVWGLQDHYASRQTIDDYAQGMADKMPYQRHLPKAMRYLREYSKGTKLSAVSDAWVEGYRDHLMKYVNGEAGRKLSQTTASHYYAAVKHVLKLAVQEKILIRMPGEYVKGITEPEAEKVWLEPDELARLWSTSPMGSLGAEIRLGFFFAVYTGLRVSDVKSLAWGDILRDPPRIMKRQKKTKTYTGLPMSASAWEIIDDGEIHRRDELVFPALTKSSTEHSQYFRDWERKAGLDFHIGWHTGRHTFAVLSLDAGVDLYTVSKLMGHKSIKTTQVYAKATTAMQRSAIEKLEASARSKLPKADEEKIVKMD